ncbi:phenylalanine--tRNA ligase subunit beta [Candidatus Saccharibacteria bacterium]|nr:phenylalanine--tRNA ligase subunit beta [Candidatus Saccharibacteria bacterium]
MKISLNWIKQFTDVNLSVDELVKKIGAQLGAVEEVIDLEERYRGIFVAQVVSCEKHPNADKLNVCKIDDGGQAKDIERDDNGLVQVVCGAPNVRVGLKVAWLPPGVTVPSTADKDPFVLGSRELRGVMSSGMLASSAELAIGDDHGGIAELDTPAEPGTYFAEAYELNDYIIDIENKMFTHRPDCFGILGVAREIAGIQGIKFTSPDWYKSSLGRIKPESSKITLDVRNGATELVPRFMAVALSDLRVGPSPFIIQTYLARVGLKPINNIVDVTNYLMYLTGQPTHAYDANKLRIISGTNDTVKLETRMSRAGDKVMLLNGKEVELKDNSTILITSNDIPVAIGGVMGGKDTQVDENTKDIVLECANFDMYSIRRTSMKYGLFTDGVTRFNKGQSALQNDVVTEEAVTTLIYVAGGHVASDVVDIKNKQFEISPVKVSSEFVNERLGLELSTVEMSELLANVEFTVKVSGTELSISHPYWRTDIEIAEDIVEEVGRLHGFDRLPIQLPRRSIKPVERDKLLALKTDIRHTLAKAGANEVLTYGFVHRNLLDKNGQSRKEAFELGNALSPSLQYYRTSLTPSLLEKVHVNVKLGYGQFAIFEIGKSHIKGQQDQREVTVPMEFNAVSLVFAADEKTSKSYNGAVFYQANLYLDTLARACRTQIIKRPANDEVLRSNPVLSHVAAPYDLSRSAIVCDINGTVFGIVGEFKQSVAKSLKLPQYSAGFEIGLRALQSKSNDATYKPLSRFPKAEQDLSLRVSSDTRYADVKVLLDEELGKLTGLNIYANIAPVDIFQKDNNKHITFRLTAAHNEKTMQTAEVSGLLDKLATIASQKLGSERL